MASKEKKKERKKEAKRIRGFGTARERDFAVENLSALLGAGMSVSEALESVGNDIRSKRLRKVLEGIREDIEVGATLWQALERTGLFPPQTVALIRIGEESGKLPENLQVVSAQQAKDRDFQSKLRSAMLYPLFVLSLTTVVGTGVAWFILPNLALVFSQLRIDLPLVTRILIGIGQFLGVYGTIVVPLALAAAAVAIYLVFVFPPTRFIGQWIVFRLPGIGELIRELELARFGHLLGTLLEAGLPVVPAIQSLAQATDLSDYRRLYTRLAASIDDGNSFQKAFASEKRLKRLIPTPVQQLVANGERSGMLAETLKKIGVMYETKTELTTKNFAVLLEPILLVIVWLGVVAVALAVILPIYSLIGGLNAGQQIPPPPAASDVPEEAPVEDAPAAEEPVIEENIAEEAPAAEPPPTVTILPTGIGYLNVREQPTTASPIVGRVEPGESYEYTDERDGWYEILLPDGTTGWITGEYAQVD